MAFIAKLPDADALLRSGPAGHFGPYGPHLTFAVSNSGVAVSLMTTVGGPGRLVSSHGGSTFHVELGRLDPITVPYVNRFLAASGSVIIKDWRTLEYRVKTRTVKSNRKARRAAMAQAAVVTAQPSTPRPKPRPVQVTPSPALPAAEAASEPHVPVEPSAAVFTVTADNVSDPIPGMVYPKGKVIAKGAGTGFMNVGGIILRSDDVATLDDAWQMRQNGEVAAVLITGPAGTAKTMLVKAFAAKLGVPYLKVDCSTIRSVDDWSGGLKQDPATKTWAHRWSPFARALREGKPCVVLLDELTRTESPAALNGVLGLLDETGSMNVIDANTTLTLPKGVLIVATANIGPEFVGTLPLDGAVRQRFAFGVRMDYTTESIEAKLLVDRTGVTREVADGLVRMAVQQRKHRDDAQRFPSGGVISTRLLLAMASAIAKGRENRAAVWSVLKAQFDPADDAGLTVVVDAQFPKGKPPVSAPTEATIIAGKHYFQANPFIGTSCGFVPVGTSNACGLAESHPIHDM
jgi:MoxR-like ATPase